MKIKEIGEFGLIERIHARAGRSSYPVVIGIGDDASVGILANLLETSAGNLRQEIELSLLQGSLNKDIAVTLATIGSNGSIRSAALQHLIRLDIEAAGGVVRAILEEPSSMDKEKLLKTALESELQNEIIKGLKGMAPMDQLVVLGFIADKRLTTHEQAVLDLLSSENETVKTGAIETLGHIGGDASLDTLLALYVEDEDNDTTVMALARLNSDSIDARLIDLVNKDQGDTLSAIKILALRNPDGLTDMANQWAGSDNPGEMRSASFRALERIGNIESVKLLLATIIAQETLSRPAQQSLIKLSVNMGIPAYQWEHAYQPALQSADNLESKKAVIAILYGISCQETAEFLAGLIASDSTLRDQALRSLIRWRNISSSTVWLDLISSPEASPDDIRNALRGISRILSQDSVKGDDKAKVQLAVEAIEKAPNAQFKQDILAIYEDPDFDFESSDRRAIKGLFPDLVEDPDIGPAAQAILDHVLEMD